MGCGPSRDRAVSVKQGASVDELLPVGLAGAAQLRMLPEIQARGQLGCFLLTEMQAGMLLGPRRAAGHRHTVVLLTIGPTACGPHH